MILRQSSTKAQIKIPAFNEKSTHEFSLLRSIQTDAGRFSLSTSKSILNLVENEKVYFNFSP
jgi:hypothetical protein